MSEFEEQIEVKTDKESQIGDNNPPKKISGWLTFFLVVIGIGGVISPIIGFTSMSLSNYDVGFGYWCLVVGAICDSILLLGYPILAFYIINSFKNYKPNAVGLARAYLVIAIATNLLGLFTGEYDSSVFDSMPQMISRVFWQIIWIIYLSTSKQVKSLFPKEERKLFKRDKILIISIVAPVTIYLLSVFVIAWGQESATQRQMQEYVISEDNLSYGEYTDGRIIFRNPSELTVENKLTENETFFLLTQGDEISITIYSTFDNADTKEYFEEVMSAWSDATLKDFEFDVIDEQHYNRNGNSVYLKTLRYRSEPILEWSCVLIFNDETGKCVVVSAYSNIGTMEFLPDLINSIRFKR